MALPVLTIHNGALRFGTKSLFEDIHINILENDHVCLIGRNGEGKSTLLKVLCGMAELDAGNFYKRPHTKVHYLPQDLELKSGKELGDIVMESGCQRYEAEALLDALEMPLDKIADNLSGGEKRRVLLARTLAGEPDVLMLDEPTNHLDIKGIQWLQEYLNSYKKAVIMISHDRRFLAETSRSIAWLDRQQIRRCNKGYAFFDQWMEEVETQDSRALAKIESKLRLEEHWKIRGVTARRKRNQGRLEKLHQMRDRRKQLLSSQPKSVELEGKAKMHGSQLVSELVDITKAYEGSLSLGPFSTRIFKGDRIGIVGPNGCGKSTLIKMITGQLKPDTGKVRIGKTIELSIFEQERNAMDLTDSPWRYLCPGGGDTIDVQGTPVHIIGYLKRFLFDHEQAKGAMSILSGGEKNRLQLAKILAEDSNVLVLDEPTNDLDMDTLDLLIDMLSEYKGTLILISHDRDFIDQLVTAVFAIQPNGTVVENVGGYTDYEKKYHPTYLPVSKKSLKKKDKKEKHEQTCKAKKMTYMERKDYKEIPTQLTKIEKHIHEIEEKLHDPKLYADNPELFDKLSNEHAGLKTEHDTLENRWLELSMLSE